MTFEGFWLINRFKKNISVRLSVNEEKITDTVLVKRTKNCEKTSKAFTSKKKNQLKKPV